MTKKKELEKSFQSIFYRSKDRAKLEVPSDNFDKIRP